MINVAVIGVGNRARKYLSCLPDGVRVICLVEPDPLRLAQAARRYGVAPSACFSSADDFFAAAPSVDAVIVAAPDRLHVPLSLRAVQHGWHVLLEKPVATSEKDYIALMDASAAAGVHVGVCLEMRFHPYFRRIKEIYESGVLGRIRSIDHTEHIGPDRMAHTFVRGLWSRVEDAGPIFLSKCCHDADFILWLTGQEPLSVRSSGALVKFRFDESMPEFCVDCDREDCPYSAVSLYRERREWIDGFDIPDGSSLAEVIDAELRGGRYGRCVFRCDNNVFDTQDVEVELSGGVELTMHLEGTSFLEGRRTVICGDVGTMVADGGRIVVTFRPEHSSLSFRPERSGVEKSPGQYTDIVEDYTSLAGLPLHAGADKALVEDFFAAIAAGRTPSASLESAYQAHRLCWLAG